MDHVINDVRQETISSWSILCSCGWKEKGISESVVRGRFTTHKNQVTK